MQKENDVAEVKDQVKHDIAYVGEMLSKICRVISFSVKLEVMLCGR